MDAASRRRRPESLPRAVAVAIQLLSLAVEPARCGGGRGAQLLLRQTSWASASERAASRFPGFVWPFGTKVPNDVDKAHSAVLEDIADTQARLLGRLATIRRDLGALDKRVQFDLIAANHSLLELTSISGRAHDTFLRASENRAAVDTINTSIAQWEAQSNDTMHMLVGLNTTALGIQEKLNNGVSLYEAKPRIDNSIHATMLVRPKLQSLNRRLHKIELRLRGGNLTHMVDDAVDSEMTNLIQDVGRGILQDVPNK